MKYKIIASSSSIKKSLSFSDVRTTLSSVRRDRRNTMPSGKLSRVASQLNLISEKDTLSNDKHQRVAKLLATRLLADISPKTCYPVVLGNSMSWIATIAKILDPSFNFSTFSMSGNNYSFDRESNSFVKDESRTPSELQKQNMYTYLEESKLDAFSIIAREKPTVILEYVENGRGLYTFIKLLESQITDHYKDAIEFATEVNDLASVETFTEDMNNDLKELKSKLTFWIYKNTTGFPDVTSTNSFAGYQISKIESPKYDSFVQDICDDETTRFVASHKFYKEDAPARPETLNNQLEVVMKERFLSERMHSVRVDSPPESPIQRLSLSPKPKSPQEMQHFFRTCREEGLKPVYKFFIAENGSDYSVLSQSSFAERNGKLSPIKGKHRALFESSHGQTTQLPNGFSGARLMFTSENTAELEAQSKHFGTAETDETFFRALESIKSHFQLDGHFDTKISPKIKRPSENFDISNFRKKAQEVGFVSVNSAWA